MAINDLIAMGGTQIKSPVQRYLETKSQMAQEERNRLAEAATRQTMGIQQRQDVRAQETHQAQQFESFGKTVTPLLEQVESLPEADRPVAFAQLFPQIKGIAQRIGVDTSDMTPDYDPAENAALISRFGKPLEGSQINAMMPDGTIVPGVVNKAGQIVHPETREILSGATKAPSRQQTQEVTSFTESDKSKLEKESLAAEQDINKLVYGLDQLKTFVKSPNYIGGTTGDVVSAGNTLLAQFRQITGIKPTNGRIPEGDLEDKGEYSRLRKAAQEGDQRAALEIELAYNIAKSWDRGGRVTDADFRFAKQVIEGSADPDSVAKMIDNFRDKSIKNYNAGEKLLSSRVKKEPRLFTEEKYSELYGVKPKKETPKTEVDTWIEQGW